MVDAEPVTVTVGSGEGETRCGVTTQMTEHSLTVFLDEGEQLGVGDCVSVSVEAGGHRAVLKGVVTEVRETRSGTARTQRIEILDFGENRYEYREILYDRVPTLPQSYQRDFGSLSHLWQNIACRVARTIK